MALFIYEEDGTVHETHVNVGANFRNIAKNVIEVQADGHELEHILSNFKYIPHKYNSRVVRWYGDQAKFIAGNWRV